MKVMRGDKNIHPPQKKTTNKTNPNPKLLMAVILCSNQNLPVAWCNFPKPEVR